MDVSDGLVGAFIMRRLEIALDKLDIKLLVLIVVIERLEQKLLPVV